MKIREKIKLWRSLFGADDVQTELARRIMFQNRRNDELESKLMAMQRHADALQDALEEADYKSSRAANYLIKIEQLSELLVERTKERDKIQAALLQAQNELLSKHEQVTASSCVKDQADAWMAVCGVLHEVDPDWVDRTSSVHDTGVDLACAAIRRLAERSATP